MKLYGLIGYPLGHSFSKTYFTEKFNKEELTDCSYELFPISSINELPSIISINNLQGFNVTIPYKQQVLQYVTETTQAVKNIGAANTIKIIDDKLIAYNTDVIGFEKSFISKRKLFHNKALILGTGGSSKAVQYVLNKLNIEFLLVSSTQIITQKVISYLMIDEAIMQEYTVIINCTPVGMYPNNLECPQIPYHLISNRHYLFDLVYKPAKTLFLEKGEKQAAIIENGYNMLIIQAEESWKIWNEP